MRIQKETRSPAATGIERVRENLYTGNNTTQERVLQPIENFLPQGAENAISSRELERLSGIGNYRDLQKVIEHRRRSVPILSCSRGYYLPQDGAAGIDEVEHCCRLLEKMGNNTIRTAQAIRKSASGQQMACSGWCDSL